MARWLGVMILVCYGVVLAAPQALGAIIIDTIAIVLIAPVIYDALKGT